MLSGKSLATTFESELTCSLLIEIISILIVNGLKDENAVRALKLMPNIISELCRIEIRISSATPKSLF